MSYAVIPHCIMPESGIMYKKGIVPLLKSELKEPDKCYDYVIALVLRNQDGRIVANRDKIDREAFTFIETRSTECLVKEGYYYDLSVIRDYIKEHHKEWISYMYKTTPLVQGTIVIDNVAYRVINLFVEEKVINNFMSEGDDLISPNYFTSDDIWSKILLQEL